MTTTFMYMSYTSVFFLIVIYAPVCLGVIWIVNKALTKGNVGVSFRTGILSLLAIAMFLLPTWDAILGKYHLDQFCEMDGGTYINRYDHVDGMYLGSRPRDDIAKSFLKRASDRGRTFHFSLKHND